MRPHSMTVRAHQFAFIDLDQNPFQRPAIPNHLTNASNFGTRHMIEIHNYRGVLLGTISARLTL
jgi:hypothetical protein